MYTTSLVTLNKTLTRFFPLFHHCYKTFESLNLIFSQPRFQFLSISGKAFGTQHNLEVHGVVHSGFKPYTCKVCGKSFARRAEIRDHERTHTGNLSLQFNIYERLYTN